MEAFFWRGRAATTAKRDVGATRHGSKWNSIAALYFHGTLLIPHELICLLSPVHFSQSSGVFSTPILREVRENVA